MTESMICEGCGTPLSDCGSVGFACLNESCSYELDLAIAWLKEQKERELAYYREQLEIIQEKLVWIEREYKLTKDIIKMIEQETIVSIKPN